MEINIIEALQEKRRKLHQEIQTIDKVIDLLDGSSGTSRQRSNSAATRRPMSEAMKA